ncbi:MAG: SCO family protein [Candidatus Binatia bacterium]
MRKTMCRGLALFVMMTCAPGAQAEDTSAGAKPHAELPADPAPDLAPAEAPAVAKRHATLPADAPLDPASIYQLESKWTRADGETVALPSLRGKPRVLAIFYSSCEFACPIVVGRMKAIQAAIPEARRDAAGFVLVSMDVANDDPSKLADYAKRMDLQGDWTLLRGKDGDVRELAALLGFRYRQEQDGGFAHSNMITVLDGEGRVAHQSIGLDTDLADAIAATNGLLGP